MRYIFYTYAYASNGIKKLHTKLRRRKLVYGNFSLLKFLIFLFFKARRAHLWVTLKIKKKNLKSKTHPHPHTPLKRGRKGKKRKRKNEKEMTKKLWKYAMSLIGIYPAKIVTAADKDVVSWGLQLSIWGQKIRHNLNGSWCGMCCINPVVIIESRPVS